MSGLTTLATLQAELKALNAQEDMFDLELTKHDGLSQCADNLLMLKRVWDLASLVSWSYQRWQDMKWHGLDLESLRPEVNGVLETVKTAGADGDDDGNDFELDQAHWRRWPVYVSLKDKLMLMLDSLELMGMLQSPMLRQRHWKLLMRFTGPGITGSGMLNEDEMRLAEMMALNLPLHSQAVRNLVRSAEEESKIETLLDQMEQNWTSLELRMSPDDDGQQKLLPPNEVLAVLHESLVHVQALQFNPHVLRNSAFSDQVARLQHQLGTTETLLNNWMLAQSKHSTLVALMQTAAARERCAEVAADFDAINDAWDTMMAQAAMVLNVVETIATDERSQQVLALLARIENVESQLQAYLHSHRTEVPCFFLLSNQALLSLLSLEGHPEKAIPYTRVLLPGVHDFGLEFRDNGETQVLTSVQDRDGQRMEGLEIICNGPVEDWISQLGLAIQEAVEAEVLEVVQAMVEDRQEAAANSVLQLIIVALGIEHTASIQMLLAPDKEKEGVLSFETLKTKQQSELEEWLSQLCNPKALANERSRLSAIVIDCMGWRDVMLALAAEKDFDRSASSFAWLSQIRYSVTAGSKQEESRCMVTIGNQQTAYGCSFIGHELSQTMRTTSIRALQLSMSLAVQMSAGVLVQGGAGCGKTQTLRGTAHAFGNLCGTIVGSETTTEQSLLDSLTGLAYGGVWTEIRNVSRLPVNVLSLLCQAARSVLDACRMNRARQARSQESDIRASINGVEVSVGTGFALLSIAKFGEAGTGTFPQDGVATWNNILGKHTGLPLSLGLLFRPVGMLSVESTTLVAVWLLTSGFQNAGKLAGVLSDFVESCKRLLSIAPQYTWSLRCMKSVVNLAASRIRTQLPPDLMATVSSNAQETKKHAHDRFRAEMKIVGAAVVDLITPRLLAYDQKPFDTLVTMFFHLDDASYDGMQDDQTGNGQMPPDVSQQPIGEPIVFGAEISDSATVYHEQPQGASGEESDMISSALPDLDLAHVTSRPNSAARAEVMLRPQSATSSVSRPLSAAAGRPRVNSQESGQEQSVDFESADIGAVGNTLARDEPSVKGVRDELSTISSVVLGEDSKDELEVLCGAESKSAEVTGDGVQSLFESHLKLAVQPLHLQLTDKFAARCMQLHLLLHNFSSCFVLGPPGSGKSSLIQTISSAHRSESGVAANVRHVNPKAISPMCLFGLPDPTQKLKQVDGVLPALLRGMAEVDSETPQQWIVLDGPIDPSWADLIGTLVPDDGQLLIGQECIGKNPMLKMVFECENVCHASPSMLASGGIVTLCSADVGWGAYAQRWLAEYDDGNEKFLLRKLLAPDDDCIISQALTFLSAECPFASVFNEARENGKALIHMLCSLLTGSQLLQRQRSADDAVTGRTVPRPVTPGAPDGQGSDDYHLKRLVCSFAYSLVWSLGGLLDREGKIKFNAFVRQAADDGLFGGSEYWVPYPRTGNVFDFYFDPVDVTWKVFSESVREFRYLWGGSDDDASELVLVPTQQNIALQHTMLHLERARHPIMLHGAAGTGKSCIVGDFLATLDPEKMITASIVLNGSISAQHFQNALQVSLEHKSGGLLAPTGSKRATFFVDDLHLPQQDAYDAQPVVELLRHVLEYGKWFDFDQCTERTIQNCSFIAAMPPSRTWVTQSRFRRHFACLHVDNPTPEGLHYVYEALAVSILRTFDSDVQRLAAPLAHATVKILLDLSSVLMPTAQSPHYFLTQHDLGKVFKGIQAHPELCTSVLAVAHLWLFNCHTTFMGRISNEDDRIMSQRIISRAADTVYETMDIRDAALAKASFLCIKQQGRRRKPFLVKNSRELCVRITENLSVSLPTAGSSAMLGAPSVADQQAVATLYDGQISHLSMALARAGGHALLVGPGGGGKKTVAAITARLLGYKLVELDVKDSLDQRLSAAELASDLRQRLCDIYWEAGIGKTDTVLLVHEHVIGNELVAALLSEALADGAFSQVIAIFSETQRLEIYSLLRGEVRKMGMVDSHENCWLLFTIHLQHHLHLVILESSNNALLDWSKMVLAYPLLLTRMSVCWFYGNDSARMQDFATVYLEEKLKNEKDGQVAGHDDDTVLPAARHMSLVHQAAMELATNYAGAGRHLNSHTGTQKFGVAPDRSVPVPLPTASLSWYCQAWSAIYTARRDHVVRKHAMAKRASSKLGGALSRLRDLETSLEDQKQVVEQKKLAANRLLAQVGQETALLDEQRAVLLDDEQKQQELSQNLSELQQQLKSQVDLAAPLLQKAEDGLSKLSFENISELRTLQSPSESLLVASRAVAIILTPSDKPLPTQETLVWKEVKKMFSKVESFLSSLNCFNVKDASAEAMHYVEQHFLSLDVFAEDHRDPLVVDGLKTWAVNIVAMYHVYEMIKPQQKELNAASKEWEHMLTKVSDLSGRVDTLEARLHELMGSFQEATEEKNSAMARLQDLTSSCGIAGKLAGALQLSGANPIEEAWARYQEEEASLLGDALLAAALVTYTGWMDTACRDSFMQDHVLADLRAQKLRVSTDSPSSALQVLTTPATMANWRASGLLEPRFYAESASIALHGAAWPLLVDPEGLALAWLTSHVADQSPPRVAGVGASTPMRKRMAVDTAAELTVVSNTRADLVSVLQTCLPLGRSVAIVGPLTTVRREILSVLLRAFAVHKRVTVVQLAGKPVEVHADFRLFLLTGSGRLTFAPQLANMCSVVNFMCSVAGLHDAILDLVIRAEIPDMSERTALVLDRRRSLLQEEQHLQDSMLLALGESDGIVLSDEVVNRLVDDLGLMDRVATKLEAAARDERKLAASRQAYWPVVETVVGILLAAEQMEQVNVDYVFSSEILLGAVAEGLEGAVAELEPFEWHSIFVGDWGGEQDAFSDVEDEDGAPYYEDGGAGGGDGAGAGASQGPEHTDVEMPGPAQAREDPGNTPALDAVSVHQPAGAQSAGEMAQAELAPVAPPAARDKAGGEAGEEVTAGGSGGSPLPEPKGSSRPESQRTRPASRASRGSSARGSASAAASQRSASAGTVLLPDAAARLSVLQAHVWRAMLREVCAGMLADDHLVFATHAAFTVFVARSSGAERVRAVEVLAPFLACVYVFLHLRTCACGLCSCLHACVHVHVHECKRAA